MIAEFLLEQSKNILICIALFLGVKCELKYHEMLEEREVLYKVLTDFEKKQNTTESRRRNRWTRHLTK